MIVCLYDCVVWIDVCARCSPYTYTYKMTNERVKDKEEEFKIDGLVMNNDGDDSKGGKGIMGNKMLIWHCLWLGLAVVSLVVLIAYANVKSLRENQLKWIKFIVIPALVIPTIVEIIVLIVNKSEDNMNKGEEDDGYVRRKACFFQWMAIYVDECSCVGHGCDGGYVFL